MRLVPLLALGSLPLLASIVSPFSSDPSFGISCGTGLPGAPGIVTLEAGPHAPRTIVVRIAASRTTADSSTSGIKVATAGESGSCTSDTGGPYNVYLNSAGAATVSLTLDSPDTVLVRGLRGGQEQSSVIIAPGHWVDARLTW